MQYYPIQYVDKLPKEDTMRVKQTIKEIEAFHSSIRIGEVSEQYMKLIYVNDLLPEAIKYKNPYFKEEEEVRLAINFIRFPRKKEFIQYRIDGGASRIINYYEQKIIKEKMSNPIKEVVLGPKNNCLEMYIDSLLQKYEFKDVEIKKSGISYI